MDILLKRGGESNRTSITPKAGEPVFTTDNHELFIGDGSTQGGRPIGTVRTSGNVATDMISLFKDATGKLLKGVTKTELLRGYASESYVNSHVTGVASGLTVSHAGTATTASTATNALSLGGALANKFMQKSLITQTATENNSGKVPSSASILKIYNELKGLITGITRNYIPNSKKSTSVSSTSSDTIATSSAVKSAYDRGSSGISIGNSAKSAAANAQSTANSANSKATTNGNTLKSLSSTVSNHSTRMNAAEAKLRGLPHKITKGTGNAPSSASDGDIFLKYKA